MWLNKQQNTELAIRSYRKTLVNSSPQHVVIDNLFNSDQLRAVCRVLQQAQQWQTQKHSYAALYVNDAKWQKTPAAERFVQRDVWQRTAPADTTALADNTAINCAQQFLAFLRGDEFMALLSRIFRVQLTDINLRSPELNTNYFRLGPQDFVNQHADDSPGREVCMLLYLNEDWQQNSGGELMFAGTAEQPVCIAPLFNRCVLFDPSSAGSEHWVTPLTAASNAAYRFNVTSWYWGK